MGRSDGLHGGAHRSTEVQTCPSRRGVASETRYHAIGTIFGHQNCDVFVVLVHNIDMRRDSLCQADKSTKTALCCKLYQRIGPWTFDVKHGLISYS